MNRSLVTPARRSAKATARRQLKPAAAQTREPKGRAHTDKQLADAIGVTRRTILRRRAAGMPMPTAGESIASWQRRAETWLRETNRRPGRPRPADAQERDLLRWRQAVALRMERRLQQLADGIHSRAECEFFARARRQQIREACDRMPGLLEHRLAGIPDADEVQARADEGMRQVITELIAQAESGEPLVYVGATPTHAGPEPEPAEDAPILERSNYWLGRRRRAAAGIEELGLALDQGKVHRLQECEADELYRIGACAQVIHNTPVRIARELTNATPAEVRAVVEREVQRAYDRLDQGYQLDDVSEAEEPASPAGAST